MKKNMLIVLALITLILSCKFKDNTRGAEPKSPEKPHVYRKDSLNHILNTNKAFIRDSLLKEKSGIVESYFARYQSDTCGVVTHENSILKEGFEGIKQVKGIRTDKKRDTVFVMPSFNYCDDGESYYFYDKSLPRLYTDSYCCRPDNFFVCSDIDEDGVNEVGIYYSTCVSRYKCLIIYSLQQNIWKETGRATFDIQTKDPQEVKFGDLVKKVSKYTFQICSFNEGVTKWDTIDMNNYRSE